MIFQFVLGIENEFAEEKISLVFVRGYCLGIIFKRVWIYNKMFSFINESRYGF